MFSSYIRKKGRTALGFPNANAVPTRGQFWSLNMVSPQDDFWQQGTNFGCQTLLYGTGFVK